MVTETCQRINKDIIKLIASNHEVRFLRKNNEFLVRFKGPMQTIYEGGTWIIHLTLRNYPFSAPSIHFINKIFHPNICMEAGFVCLDVLGNKWRPTYDLKHVFEVFLPELLACPNPSDALNAQAGSLFYYSQLQYKKIVSSCIKIFAGFGDKKVSVLVSGSDFVVKKASEDEENLSESSSSALTEVEENDEFSLII